MDGPFAMDEAKLRILRLEGAFSRACRTALREEAEVIMTVAKERTPVDKGHLRASGRVETEGYEVGDFAVKLRFGNNAVDYAVYVHYNLEAHHKVGQALFLSSAIDEAMPGIADRVSKRAEALFREDVSSL